MFGFGIISIAVFLVLSFIVHCGESFEQYAQTYEKGYALFENSRFDTVQCVEYDLTIVFASNKMNGWEASFCSRRKNRAIPIAVAGFILASGSIILHFLGDNEEEIRIRNDLKLEKDIQQLKRALVEAQDNHEKEIYQMKLQSVLNNANLDNIFEIADFNVTKFAEDFDVPREYATSYWNNFDTRAFCNQNGEIAISVCGKKNPSREMGKLYEVFPLGHFQHNAQVYRRYEFNPYIVQIGDFNVTAERCKEMGDLTVCYAAENNCTLKKVDECVLSAHNTYDGVFVENRGKRTLVAAEVQTFDIFDGEKRTTEHMPSSGHIVLTMEVGKWAVVNNVKIQGMNVKTIVHRMMVAPLLPILTHEEIDKFEEQSTKTVAELEHLRAHVKEGFFADIAANIKRKISKFLEFSLLIVVVISSIILVSVFCYIKFCICHPVSHVVRVNNYSSSEKSFDSFAESLSVC